MIYPCGDKLRRLEAASASCLFSRKKRNKRILTGAPFLLEGFFITKIPVLAGDSGAEEFLQNKRILLSRKGTGTFRRKGTGTFRRKGTGTFRRKNIGTVSWLPISPR